MIGLISSPIHYHHPTFQCFRYERRYERFYYLMVRAGDEGMSNKRSVTLYYLFLVLERVSAKCDNSTMEATSRQ